eukprot:TRINITY_DN204_c1_g4_i1.p1 TRINITY_DN204_c1_g4~~TRINITY_DN204_c1_g4_i1.p1  ORF type:complete len:180 (+),score=47.49 TRINITY_DN204_c1_g4_i1:122-661(+)
MWGQARALLLLLGAANMQLDVINGRPSLGSGGVIDASGIIKTEMLDLILSAGTNGTVNRTTSEAVPRYDAPAGAFYTETRTDTREGSSPASGADEDSAKTDGGMFVLVSFEWPWGSSASGVAWPVWRYALAALTALALPGAVLALVLARRERVRAVALAAHGAAAQAYAKLVGPAAALC